MPQDLVRSAMWLNVAIAGADGVDLVRWRDHRQLVWEALTAAELVEAQEHSVACFTSAFQDCGEAE
jgi:hypothetical protein